MNRLLHPLVLLPLVMLFTLIWLAWGDLRSFGATDRSQIQTLLTYREHANLAEDVAQALHLAQRSERRVLLQLGGTWCSWCRVFDDFLRSSPSVRATLEGRFVLVRTYVDPYDPGRHTQPWCRETPSIFPYLCVLDERGNPITERGAQLFWKQDHYDPTALKSFLRQYGA